MKNDPDYGKLFRAKANFAHPSVLNPELTVVFEIGQLVTYLGFASASRTEGFQDVLLRCDAGYTWPFVLGVFNSLFERVAC